MTSTDTVPAPDQLARQAADQISALTGIERHDAAVVLGSGWAPAADAIGTPNADISFTDLIGFTEPSVAGHAGRLRSVTVGARHVLVFVGRTHLYEGRGAAAVVHGVRTAAAAGANTIVLTNAAGGLRPENPVGAPILISDHLNLTAISPLVGPHFVDLTDLYSARLRALARQVEPSLREGVYAALPGPHYETPAEIRALRTLGADLVGMSTALEAIAARAAGAELLGISLVTNFAAGVTDEPLDHREVLAAGRAAASRMGSLLASVLAAL